MSARFSPAFPIAAALCLMAAPFLRAHPDVSVLVSHYDEEIRKHPKAYGERWERAWLVLDHPESAAPVQDDIDTLLAHPEWRPQGLRLRAIRLFQEGRYREAETQIRKNMESGSDGPEQDRMLARIKSFRGDFRAAQRIYRKAWEKRKSLEEYLAMLEAYRSHGPVPVDVLERGRQMYPGSAGAAQAIFDGYLSLGEPAGLEKGLEISSQAQSAWWPSSVDWKLRHARALLALSRPDAARAVLLEALDLVDGDPRLQTNAGTAPSMRREIFSLLVSTGI